MADPGDQVGAHVLNLALFFVGGLQLGGHAVERFGQVGDFIVAR